MLDVSIINFIQKDISFPKCLRETLVLVHKKLFYSVGVPKVVQMIWFALDFHNAVILLL